MPNPALIRAVMQNRERMAQSPRPPEGPMQPHICEGCGKEDGSVFSNPLCEDFDRLLQEVAEREGTKA